MDIIYRQGDVALILLKEAVFPSPEEEDSKILQTRILRRGENGGVHRFEKKPDVTLYEHEGVRFLHAPTGVRVTGHHEHGDLELPPGTYRLQIQREQQAGGGFRHVAD